MKITFSKQAIKDLQKIKQQKNLSGNVFKLLEILEVNPLQTPPPYEKLAGDLQGLYSRRINLKHRLVYQILDNEVKVLSLWTHYENL